MARALFFSLPLHGHVNPSLALVGELTRRGDAIVYYATSRFRTDVQKAGAHHREYRDQLLADLSALPEQTDALSWLLMTTSQRVLQTHLDEFKAERPDYVITDSVAPWGQWVAKILGVPLVTSISTFAFNRKVMAFAVKHGIRPESASRFVSKLRHILKASRLRREISRTYGVNGPGVMNSVMGHSDLNIVYTSRLFQPCADSFDDRFQFIGPQLSRAETTTFPWERLDHSDVVYVSLGTLFNAEPEFYRRCFVAFADQPFRVVLSTGTNVSPASLGPAPENFVVAPHVPQLAVLQRAKAFVTHGGMNSVSESLSNGVPMVVVPQMSEQALVGRQVEALGAGIFLRKGEATADRLRDAVRQVCTDGRYSSGAAVIKRSFLDAGGVTKAGDEIFRFTR